MISDTREPLIACARQSGFTMLELVLTIGILSLFGAVALPSLTGLSGTFNRMNARTVIIQDIKRAQAQALTEGCRGILELHENQTGYSFGCDYLPYDSSVPASADVISFNRNLPTDIQINLSQQIIFNSRGQSVDHFDIISTVNVALEDLSEGETIFATGTLLGTGLFSYN